MFHHEAKTVGTARAPERRRRAHIHISRAMPLDAPTTGVGRDATKWLHIAAT